MADSHEPRRQHVQQESPDELRGGQGHDLNPVMVASIPILKADRSIVDRQDSVIADGHAMGVAAEIFQRSLRSVERRFGVEAPCLAVEFVQHCGELSRIARRPGEVQLVLVAYGLEAGEELASEHLAKRSYGEEELGVG